MELLGIAVFVILVAVVFYSNLTTGRLPNGFLNLAYGFVEKRLDLGWFPTTLDMTVVDGKTYLPQGPLPAILLLPFAYFRKYWYGNNAGYLSVLLNLINLGSVFLIAKAVLKDKFWAFWMMMTYVFVSPYLGIAMEAVVWYQGQLTAVTFLLLSLCLYLYKRDYFWVGLCMALAMAARLNAGLMGLFYIAIILGETKKRLNSRVIELVKFGMPIVVILVGLGWYNFQRFGSVWESGYTKQRIYPPVTAEQRDKGWYRAENIPTNFYYYFLRGLDPVILDSHKLDEYRLRYPFFTMDPNGPGWGFFYMSPVFILLFLRRPRGMEDWSAILTIGVILAMLMLFFVPGSRQFGPRYLNDLLPLLFLLLLKAVAERGVGRGLKLLILVTAAFNVWVFLSYNAVIKY